MPDRKWKKVSEKVVYEDRPFFWVTEDVVTRPDGKQTNYGVIHTNGAVFIVVVTMEGRLVFIEQDRYPVGRSTLEIVAGGLGKGVDPLEQAKAEVQEEIGIEGVEVELLGTLMAAPARQNVAISACLVRGVNEKDLHLGNQEGNEAINAIKVFEPEVVVGMIRNGGLEDVMTIACLNLYWAKYGFPGKTN